METGHPSTRVVETGLKTLNATYLHHSILFTTFYILSLFLIQLLAVTSNKDIFMSMFICVYCLFASFMLIYKTDNELTTEMLIRQG